MLQLRLIILITLINCAVSQFTTLNDLPWKILVTNWTIDATITDKGSGETFSIREYVQVTDTVRGKITINGSPDRESVEIFYSSKSQNRLMIRGYYCDLFTYNNGWDKNLFDGIGPLLNHLLLTGPSILFRINGGQLSWTQGPDSVIRGQTVHTLSAGFSSILNITFNHKVFGRSEELSEAVRLEFDGYESTFGYSGHEENLFIDFYSVIKVDENFEQIVSITPGIGCPDYSIGESDLYPYLRGMRINYLDKVVIDGPSKSISENEVFIDTEYGVAKVRTISQEGRSVSLYDYKLKIVYTRQNDGKCSVSAIRSDGYGIENPYDGYTQLYHLLDMGADGVNYIGERYYDGKSKLLTKVWERVAYNYQLNGKRYDKVVFNHYFVPDPEAVFLNGHILVGNRINAYNKLTNESYKLIETTQRDFYNFYKANTESEYDIRFENGDCYSGVYDKKIFAFHFGGMNSVSIWKKRARKYLTQFRSNIRIEISQKFISLSRIGDVDIVFGENAQIIAYITIYEVPNVKGILKPTSMMVDKETLDNAIVTRVSSEDKCLGVDATIFFDAIVYCDRKSDQSPRNFCGRVKNLNSIKEDRVNGVRCNVYYVSYDALERHKRETPLDKVVDHLNNNRIFVPIDARLGPVYAYELQKVVDVTPEIDQTNGLFKIAGVDEKLTGGSTSEVTTIGANDLGDCYRYCSKSGHDCETFSFCQYPDKVLCFKSREPYSNLSMVTVRDTSCKVYSKNHLLDFNRIPSKEFIPQSTGKTSSLGECASECVASVGCYSFQYCEGDCVFGGHFMDSLTTESTKCDLYVQKTSQKYRATGRTLVVEAYHTEFNLNMDQCAALCHSWTDRDVHCRSFNFCSRGTSNSSCSLTKHSVKDASVETIDSNTCRNYELIVEDEMRKSSNNQVKVVNSTSVGAVFGIVILFLCVGLFTGFIIPQSINRISRFIAWRRSNGPMTMSWSAQVNGAYEEGEAH